MDEFHRGLTSLLLQGVAISSFGIFKFKLSTPFSEYQIIF